MALSTYQTGQSGDDGQHDTFSSPNYVSHLTAGPSCNLQGCRLDWGRQIKPIFLFPSIHYQYLTTCELNSNILEMSFASTSPQPSDLSLSHFM
jgi:hypothetical protein